MTTLPASCNIYTSIWDIDFTNINREEASKGSIKDYEEQRGPERGKGRERRGLRAAVRKRWWEGEGKCSDSSTYTAYQSL
ncbi:50S ribosomal protein [Dirofilaria immitis]